MGEFKHPMREPVGDAGRDPVTGKVIPHARDDKTAGQVEAMTALGFSVEEIAVALDLRPGQIRMHYPRELEAAGIKANMQVARAVFDMAKSGKNLPASVFWLRNRAGWTESDQPNGGQVMNIQINLG